jgi:small subunit ribosomal protein S21
MRDNYRKPKKFFKKAPKGGEISQIDVNDPFAHIQPVQAQPLEVTVYNNQFDKALRAFRALVQKERILSAYKENQSYEKPSDKRRRKRNEMKRKRLELEGNGGTFVPKKPQFKSKRPKLDEPTE